MTFCNVAVLFVSFAAVHLELLLLKILALTYMMCIQPFLAKSGFGCIFPQIWL